MVSTLAYVFMIGLPAAGTLAAVLAMVSAHNRAMTDMATSRATPIVKTRLMAFFILPGTLLILSLALIILYSTRDADKLSSSIQDYGAMAYGIPALVAGISIGMVYHRRLGGVLRNPLLFARVLSLAILPIAVAIFGMIISSQVFNSGVNRQAGVDSFVEPAMTAAILVSIGSLGGFLTAHLSSSVGDLETLDGYRKAMRRSHIGDAVSIPLFMLAFGYLLVM